MDLNNVIKIVGAASLVGFGILSVIAPRLVGNFGHMNLPDGRALTEMRVGFGGLLIGIGLIPLVAGDPNMYKVLGGCWLGSAASRVIGIVLDRPALTIDLLGLLACEIVFGLFSFA